METGRFNLESSATQLQHIQVLSNPKSPVPQLQQIWVINDSDTTYKYTTIVKFLPI